MKIEQVKVAVRTRLMLDCLRDKNQLLFEEVGLRHGLARVDFLVVARLCHGYEIRSRLDGMKRLNQRSPIYCAALDRFTVVVTDPHLIPATATVPSWWGIELANPSESGFTFSIIKEGQDNPDVDKGAIVKLLWRAEALEALHVLNAAEGVRSKARRAVYAKLAQCASLAFIREQIHFHLQQRKLAQAAAQ